VNYTYDGDGDRVQKSNGKIYWFGAGSEILDESDSSGNITDEYIFFGGKRIAHRVVSGNAIYYYAEDFLGSSRVMTTSTGTVCYDADFYPYGGERVVTNTCPQNYKFTGKERDAETNNDDFGARYYSSQFGRWISPDWSAIPAPVPYANLTNPQTLNLYAMVRDNPETFSDLDGHEDAMIQAGKDSVGGEPENPSLAKEQEDPQQPQQTTQAQGLQTVVIEQVKGEDGNPAGHVVIGVNGAPPVGLVPDSDKAAAKALVKEVVTGLANGVPQPSSVPGHVEALSKDRIITATVAIQVTPQQAAEMVKTIQSMQGSHQMYDPAFNNCVSFVEHVLHGGGVKAPTDMTPGGLVSDLKKQFPQ
ncbi:MAG TPA: RHS repeat-associated core domain-containing protein, partial [Candidatus Acidoferrales bacterium]|nr:RHS repeat-associated core domain-containing protein [Candidatus Acidoferrales bacterium]